MRASDIKLTAEDIAKKAARLSLNLGWYQFLVTQAESKIAKSGSLMIELRCAPLKEVNDQNSKVMNLSLRNNIVLPVSNPDLPEHLAPNTTGIVVSALVAMEIKGIVDYPRTIDGQLMYKGEVIEKAEQDDARVEVTQLALDKILALYDDPSELVDCAFYAQVIEKDGYTNIGSMRAELPDGVELVPAEQFEKAIVVKAKAGVPAKTNGAKATKKK